jgi:hypothetical protein
MSSRRGARLVQELKAEMGRPRATIAEQFSGGACYHNLGDFDHTAAARIAMTVHVNDLV